MNPSKYKVSYYVEELTLHFFIHIPLLSTEFDLFQFFSVPFVVNGKLMYIPQPNERYFAVSNPLSSSLSHNQLKECDSYTLKDGQFFHCANQISTRCPSSTCMGSLFEQEPEDVNATCKVVPFQDHEILIALGPHEVAVVSKDKICGQMYCPSRVLEEAIPVPSNVIVQIPSSCSLVTSKHQVKGPTSGTTKEHEIVNIEVNLQEWSIFHNFTYSTSVPERIQAIETLKANFTSLSLDHQENGRALWLAFTILSIIVILQTAYLLFECIRVTKQIKKIKTLRLGGSVPSYGRRMSA